jgi:hypothetical protein
MTKTRTTKKVTKHKRTSSKIRPKLKGVKRPLYKRILLHPVSLFGLLIIGVLIIGLTLFSSADSYGVSASVSAKALSSSATITFPSDSATIVSTPINVTGSCPLNSYVDLIRNGSFSGVSSCSANQTFSIATDLSPGVNQLQAQDYNITNQAGPASPAITITYDAPLPPPEPAPTSTKSGQLSPDANYAGSNLPSKIVIPHYDDSGHGSLLLSSQYSYQSFDTGHEYNWNMNLSGGTPPYFLTIDWGDNTSSNLVFNNDPAFVVSHSYNSSGDYNIMAQTVDADGVKVILQLTAAVKIRNIASTTQGVISSLNTPGESGVVTSGKHWLGLIWSSYLIIMLMVISFWLGEREEYLSIVKRRRLRTH